MQQRQVPQPEKSPVPPPAPAPRKTWKSQSMYIPQGRSDSPPVPAVLNRMRQRRRSSDELNSTHESVARGSTGGEDNEKDFADDTSLNVVPTPRVSTGHSRAMGLSTSYGSLVPYKSQTDDQTEDPCGTPEDTTLESCREGRTVGSVNDQKRILSQLSALRQTLLMKRQELENSISTPRMARKAKT
ncbi:hypothetical protein BIW11_03390 [Tropilaelaps mercedesae]|uniref:Uncharacterized protein n=1 Tax=Tropilaelaps mercedesae TaxID=418985 RepID=A0A1V9XMF6_9ACAR|nr:hypothetical protein BIW11_03390 [Tropilaelaps mercedesae]